MARMDQPTNKTGSPGNVFVCALVHHVSAMGGLRMGGSQDKESMLPLCNAAHTEVQSTKHLVPFKVSVHIFYTVTTSKMWQHKGLNFPTY